MKKIILILLCLFMCASCTNEKPQEKEEKETPVVADYVWPEYEHVDPSDYYKRCDDLLNEADNGTFDGELFDSLFFEGNVIEDMLNVCEIKYRENINDKYWQDENVYTSGLVANVKDYFATTAHKLTESKVKDDFKKHVGQQMFDEFVGYVEKSPEEMELVIREKELIQQYNTITDKLDDYTTTVDGKEYRYADFTVDNELINTNPRGFLDGYEDCLRQYSEDLAVVYLEMVNVRNKIAVLNGYDNYADYADEKLYQRDYTAQDLDIFKSVIKEYAQDITTYCDTLYSYGYMEVTPEEFISQVGEVMNNISPLTSKYYKKMLDEKLYSIDDNDGRYVGSFMMSSAASNIGFVFLTLQGSTWDQTCLAHEIGHYVNANLFKNDNPYVKAGTYDVFEMQSSGLEQLFLQKGESALGDYWISTCLASLCDKLYNIKLACMLNDFERFIYTSDNLTLDKINDKYYELNQEYGGYGMDYEKYGWCSIQHLFTDSMYYMSYGTAYYTALQIFAQSVENFDKAVETWTKIENTNAYNTGTLEAAKGAGLAEFTDQDAVYDTLNFIFEYMYNEYNKLYS